MKAIWTRKEASYTGEFVTFERVISYPKPVQQPHPPILFGGATDQGRARVVRYCDGWIPIDVLLDDLPEALADLHRKAVAAGRNPASLSVSVFAFEATQSDTLKRYHDLGIARVVLVAPRRLGDALPFLDRLARIMPDIASST
jgi:alkanesulfonate monooxygenase SsuD/methylene tetrahydromethanopterin reductase-like flavin-dependent oxidoreductase (luciferase family)